MKKSLIALAALSAFATAAQAQSSVTVYGNVDVAVTDTKITTNGGTSAVRGITANDQMNTGNGDGALSTSILGFRGTEDLGGGLKANFNVEWDLTDVGSGGGALGSNSRTTAALGARQSWVGLEDSKLGQLRLGRQATATHGVVSGFSAGFANNAVGTIYSAGPGGVIAPQPLSMRPHQVFVDRLVTYISPVMSGLQATLQMGESSNQNAGAAENYVKNSDVALTYTSGKFRAGVAQQEQKTKNTAAWGTSNDTTNGLLSSAVASNIGSTTAFNADLGSPAQGSEIQYKTNAYGVSYDFGIVQPFALHTIKEVTNNGASFSKQTATELGLRAPIAGTKVTAFASMYDGENKRGTNLANKDDLEGYQVGAIYALSKRTSAYAITGQQELKGSVGSTDRIKSKATSVGVRHSF
jgi:predicted porin